MEPQSETDNKNFKEKKHRRFHSSNNLKIDTLNIKKIKSANDDLQYKRDIK